MGADYGEIRRGIAKSERLVNRDNAFRDNMQIAEVFKLPRLHYVEPLK